MPKTERDATRRGGSQIQHRYRLTETAPIEVSGGYLVDGFPSTGHTSAIATASLVNTTKFTPAAIIDSERFPTVSMIRDGKPSYPTQIFVNNDLNVAVFSSYLSLPPSEHRSMARFMLSWAKKHGISWIVSSVAIGTQIPEGITVAAGSTDEARARIKDASMQVMRSGMIAGIPGALLNQASVSGQNVIIVIFNPTQEGADFRSSAKLCMAMSKLIPGASCDIGSLQRAAEQAERSMREAESEAEGRLTRGMYG